MHGNVTSENARLIMGLSLLGLMDVGSICSKTTTYEEVDLDMIYLPLPR